MIVAINCRSFLNKKYTGIGRYAYHLIKSLGEIDEENTYLLYAKKGIFNRNKHLPRFRFKNLHLVIDRFNKGMERSLGKVDVYHFPSPESLSLSKDSKIVVTIHDLIFKTFPEGHTQKTIDDTDKQFNEIVVKADRLICCSRNTMYDLQRYFNVPSYKVCLIYQGVDRSVFYRISEQECRWAERTMRLRGIKTPFILSVGTIEPRKNLENILHAFDRLRTKYKFRGKLVVIGMKGWMSDSIDGLIRKLELKKYVRFLGYLSDRELRWYYNKAEAFVFPSFYEGFGFPIVEAFCCGVPVLTSNVSSCPEVAGDAAIVVDPRSPDEIAEGIQRIIEDRNLRQSLIEKGFVRAGYFDLHRTARQTLQVYKQLYSGEPLSDNTFNNDKEQPLYADMKGAL